jgi:hypothetical protein
MLFISQGMFQFCLYERPYCRSPCTAITYTSAKRPLMPSIIMTSINAVRSYLIKPITTPRYLTTNYCLRGAAPIGLLLAKLAFKKVCAKADCSVNHYQADNGQISDNEFLAACNNPNQTIEFCGVGAHHQNVIVKNRNKQLTQTARVLLLHGTRMWPQMVDQMFWPFAIKAAAERMNSLHIDTEVHTPES